MTERLDRDCWAIGVEAWIIQDDNYEDLAVGDSRRFAVEAFAEDLSPVQGGARAAVRIEERRSVYEIVGRVVYHRDEAWILDVGILVYGDRDRLPDEAEIGDLVTGRAYLGISGPGVYPDSFAIPREAIYDWTIEAIERETTPWLKEERSYRRDTNNISFATVARTDAWDDDEGHANYVLHCKLG